MLRQTEMRGGSQVRRQRTEDRTGRQIKEIRKVVRQSVRQAADGAEQTDKAGRQNK